MGMGMGMGGSEISEGSANFVLLEIDLEFGTPRPNATEGSKKM